MPSLTPDPNKALLDRLIATERRLQAVENRRRSGRPYAWYSAGEGETYPVGVPSTILWDGYVENVSMMNPFTGALTIPYDGGYEFGFITPCVGTVTSVVCSLRRLNPAATLASQEIEFSDAFRFYPWVTVQSLAAGDSVEVNVTPSSSSVTLSTDATLIVRMI